MKHNIYAKKVVFLTLIIALLIVSSVSALDNADGITYYSFDYGYFSGLNPIDMTNNNHNGIGINVNNVSTGKIDNAFQFDGTGDEILITNDLGSHSAFSINYWYTETFSQISTHINLANNDNSDFLKTYYFLPSEVMIFQLQIDSTYKEYTIDPDTIGIKDANYHMITMSWDGEKIRTYIDTTLLNTQSLTGTLNFNDDNKQLLGVTDTGIRYMKGQLDEVLFYSGNLTQTDINELYNSNNGYNPYNNTNFTIISTNVDNFSTTINGTLYNSNNNRIITSISTNSDEIFNFTLVPNDQITYQNVGYLNYNVSSSLLMTFPRNQYLYNITAYDLNNNLVEDFILTTNIDSSTNGSVYVEYGVNNITFSKNGYYPLTFIVNALSNTDYDLHGIYNAIINITAKNGLTGANINTFNISDTYNYNYSTTNGYINYHIMMNDSINITAESEGFTTVNKIYNVSTNYTTDTISFFLYNSLYLIFKDEITNNIITGQPIDLIMLNLDGTNNNSDKYSTTTGIINTTVLVPSNYVARYNGSDYNVRNYYFSVQDNSFQNITLYLLKSSVGSNYSVQIIDQTGAIVEDAVVKDLVYDYSIHNWKISGIGTTDTDGNTIFFSNYYSYHKFIIEYDGIVRRITNPYILTSNSIIIQISIGNNYLEDYNQYYNFDSTLSFSNDNFIADYSFANNIGTTTCLYVYRVNSYNTLFNSSCSNSPSGSLVVGVLAIVGIEYEARLYIDDQLINIITFAYPPTKSNNSLLLFQIFLLIAISGVVIAVNKFYLLPIAISLTLISGNMMMLNTLNVTVLIVITITSLFISGMLWSKSQ